MKWFNWKKKNNVSIDKLNEIAQSIIDTEDIELKNEIFTIVMKINDLRKNKSTTIAELIGYDREKDAYIEPIIQGKIYRYVMLISKELDIKLETNKDKLGGLAYFYSFKKVN